MSKLIRIAVLGFTDFERTAIEAFFRHADGAQPRHELVPDLWRADCAVADADDEDAVARLLHASLMERSVLLGSTPREGAALQLPRPVNLALVLRALDTLVGTRVGSVAAQAALPTPTTATTATTAPLLPARSTVPATNHVRRVLDELAYRTITLPQDMDVRAMAALGTPHAAAGLSGARTPLPLEHVLVVTTDADDYRTVVLSLQGFGFQTHLAQGQEEALRALVRRIYRYVFIDPQSPGTDALLLCRLAREAGVPAGEPGPAVALLAHPQAATEALQRALPAADATLRRPLRQRDLLRLVGEREVRRYAFADTVESITQL